MSELNAEEQMVRGNEQRGERNLAARIEESAEQERERVRALLQERYAEMSRLLAEHRDNAKKLSESFLRLKESLKH